MEQILTGLNEQQKCAVLNSSSVLQVLAPPGSGKTKTLTARVAYLISQQGLKPWNIIVCTFTIKAAREMKERIRNFIGEKLENKLVLGTFHSIARRYLVAHGHNLALPRNFGIADASDSLAIIKRIIKRRNYNTEPSKARSRISRLKSGVKSEKPAKATVDVEQQEFEAIYDEYEDTLRASNLLDYDDLLLRCVDLLKQHPECVSNIQAVLIDEFQDTNNVQYDLMSLFAQHRKDPSKFLPSITIVGDPDQSIYSFRSAEIRNLHRMTKQYDATHVIFLEENYRSSGSILNAALEVIEQDESRPAKKLLSTHSAGDQPVLRTLPSSAAEATWIVSELQRSLALTGGLLTHCDYVILLRSASLSLHIERALGSAGIPYRMIGGLKFFDRMEIKILLDYLRVISQPDHNDALKRIINVPSRKIGDITVNALMEEAEKQKQSLWSLMLDIAQDKRKPTTKLSTQAQKGIETFMNIILTARKRILRESNTTFTVTELIQFVLQKLSFEDYLRKSHSEDFDNRWANVEELLVQATEFATVVTEDAYFDEDPLSAAEDAGQKECEAQSSLSKFLANVALAAAVDTPEDENQVPNQVTISTIHAAKGLEWPVVFIPSTSEGTIPHSRAEDTDEERRLLYVGMTRAQGLLYLSWSKQSSRSDAVQISSFLTSTKTTKCFATRGPSFTLPSIQDLARILRRQCPTPTALQDAKPSCLRIEDDLWPEGGEEISAEVTYWKANNIGNNSFDLAPPAKRQKLVLNNSSHSLDTVGPRYQSSSAPTSNLNTGFTSARTVYSSATRESSTAGLISGADLINTGFKSALAVYEETPITRPRNGSQAMAECPINQKHTALSGSKRHQIAPKAVKKSVVGQASIANFFSKPSAAKQQHAETVVNQPHNPTSNKTTTQHKPTSSTSLTPLRDLSTQTFERNTTHTSTIPPTFAKHKPGTKPFKVPSFQTHVVDENRERYILLSSSPSKAEEG